MNNRVFAKTMQNLGKRISIEVINNANFKCVRRPYSIWQKIFSNNFVADHKIKPVSTLNKPIYVGFCTLELSKSLMHDLHYIYIKNKFDAKFLFTDTDGLVYEIKTKDIYEDFYQDKNLFDFSNFPVKSKSFDSENKKVIGKMKDELKGEISDKFFGLKSKMYSLISVDDKEVTKAKGVNKKIKHREFVKVLFNKRVIRHDMKRIQSKLHRIGTYDVCKISLSCFDDERYVLDDGVNALAYFHKNIKNDAYG